MTETDIKKGLAGVVVDVTAVSKVNPETNSLLYRGYPVQELAANCTFEEVAYLLWHGELPTPEQLEEFQASSGRSASSATSRSTSSTCCRSTRIRWTSCAPRCASSAPPTPRVADASPEAQLDQAKRLFAQLPAIVAYTSVVGATRRSSSRATTSATRPTSCT